MKRALRGFVLIAYLSSAASASIVIETVPVGDVGNMPDDRGYGQVNYAYSIGKYEVTAGQYAAFLNAVGHFNYGGTKSLYNTNMANAVSGCGIARSGSMGDYVYTVDPMFVNRPVNYVSIFDACRFVNWLNNGQPIGNLETSTTEDGSYNLSSYYGFGTRNPGAEWVVASMDEWHKAAYYKGGSMQAGYWSYPTRSDETPGRDLNDISGNNANYGPYPIDAGIYTTVVGEFQNSFSAYGTFDQGGNVTEISDTILNGYVRINGGAFGSDSIFLRRNTGAGAFVTYPEAESESFGFRVVRIPGPASVVVMGIVGAAAFGHRKRDVTVFQMRSLSLPD
jgi:formylglycine-generating enzyme